MAHSESVLVLLRLLLQFWLLLRLRTLLWLQPPLLLLVLVLVVLLLGAPAGAAGIAELLSVLVLLVLVVDDAAVPPADPALCSLRDKNDWKKTPQFEVRQWYMYDTGDELPM